MPGTDYIFRMSASTRGGQGLWSPPVHFRTNGEARSIDMEAFATTGSLPSLLPPSGIDQNNENDLEESVESEYIVPDKVSK